MDKEQSVFKYSLAEVILVSAILIGLNIAGFVAANERKGNEEQQVVSTKSNTSNLQRNSANTFVSEANTVESGNVLENSNSPFMPDSNSNTALTEMNTNSYSLNNEQSNSTEPIEPSLSVGSIDGKWNFVWSAGDAFLDIKNGSGTFRSPQRYVVVQNLNVTSTADGTVLTSSGAFIENSSVRAPNYAPDSFLIKAPDDKDITIFTKDNVNSTSWERVQISSVKLVKDGKIVEVKFRFSQFDYVLDILLNSETDTMNSGIIKHDAHYEVVQDVSAQMTNEGILVTGANPTLVNTNAKAPIFAPDMFMFKKTNSGFSVMTKDNVYVKEWQNVSVR